MRHVAATLVRRDPAHEIVRPTASAVATILAETLEEDDRDGDTAGTSLLDSLIDEAATYEGDGPLPDATMLEWFRTKPRAERIQILQTCRRTEPAGS